MRQDAQYHNRTVRLPNARVAFDATGTAKRGDWVEYRERYEGGSESRRLARVIGTVSAPAIGETSAVTNWLVVLALGDGGWHCYERWIDPADVTWCSRKAPGALLAWIGQPTATLPSLKACLRLADHGTLTDRFVREAGLRLREWRMR